MMTRESNKAISNSKFYLNNKIRIIILFRNFNKRKVVVEEKKIV
jgi:hypothetical protein